MNHSQIYLPKLTFINKVLIAISSIIFVADFLLAKFASGVGLIPLLGLSGDRVLKGHIYLMATYPFLSRSILELILNSLMIWLMGSEFEENWGRKRYLGFVASAAIGGALIYLLVVTVFFSGSVIYYHPLSGLGGVVAAFSMAYGIIYPDRIFSFLMLIPVKAKYFCVILILLALYQGVASPSGVGAWGQLGAIFAAYFYLAFIARSKIQSINSVLSNLLLRSNRPKKSKAKLSIVKDESKDGPPKYWH